MKRRAKAIMIQGTMSNAGKSLIAAGLCRILWQDGYETAPFKSQNMALNSFITTEGLEMGRAQAVQALACGKEPSVLMNPILLKPVTDMGSQVIVMGEVQGNQKAMEYFRHKKEYLPEIRKAYDNLAEQNDVIVIEGAGSPAEINLKQDDIVNMGMAELADAPVLLVGDIDRGGVFAQLIGTVQLLEKEEQDRIKGLLINKFRGDASLLTPGLKQIYDKCGKEVLGVIPYMDVDIEDEDSLSEKLWQREKGEKIDIAVIHVGKLSNFTDFQAFAVEEDATVRYVEKREELGNPDVVILPGTKNTISDLLALRENGIEAAILRLSEKGTLIFGICGGYQMLGRTITDSSGTEGEKRTCRGMGLLPVHTAFAREKTRTRTEGICSILSGEFSDLSQKKVKGYEIHMGESVREEGAEPFLILQGKEDGCVCRNVAGTYLHGIFDEKAFCSTFVRMLCERKKLPYREGKKETYEQYRERQLDILADTLRSCLDMRRIYEIIGLKQPLREVVPAQIEKESFAIIGRELEHRGICLPAEEEMVTKRVIHTTADFDYVKNLYYSEGAVEKLRKALREGACIVTDTQMAKAGINKKALGKYGGGVYCFMSDEDVAKEAKERGCTRAFVSMERAAALGKPLIFAIGNAPTALVSLYELMEKKCVEPAGIIGVPVGFVNVVEAKELILEKKEEVPCIVARGRKGGSNVAAAICNALLYGIQEKG